MAEAARTTMIGSPLKSFSPAHPLFPRLSGSFLEKSFLSLAFALLGFGFLVFLGVAAQWLSYRYGIYTEGVTATGVFEIAGRPCLYKHFGEGTMTRAPYTPVYFYLSYAVSQLTGQTLLCGRLVSLFSFFLSLWVFYRLVRLEGARRPVAACMTLMTAALTRGACHFFMADMTALFFNLLGVYCLLKREKKGPRTAWRYGGLGVLFLTLAYFTKQSYVTGMAAFASYLAFRKEWKRFFGYLAAQALAIAVPSALFEVWTHGAYFENTVLGNVRQYFWQLFLLSFANHDYPRRALLFFLFALVFVVVRLARKKAGLLDLYFLVSLLSLFSLGAAGSGDNYFIEIMALSYAVFAVFFSLAADFDRRRITAFVLWAVFIGQILVFYAFGLFAYDPEWRQKSCAGRDQLSAFIRRVPGKILAEDMTLLIASERPVVYEPFEYTLIAKSGLWDEKNILECLERKEFALIVLNTNLFKDILQTSRFSRAFTTVLRANYVPLGSAAGCVLAVPKGVVSGPERGMAP